VLITASAGLKTALTRRASFDVALFGTAFPEFGIGKNDETPDNCRIIGISPAEEGASP
jgi:hypothetical protein